MFYEQGRKKPSEVHLGSWLKAVKSYVALEGRTHRENCSAGTQLTQVRP